MHRSLSSNWECFVATLRHNFPGSFFYSQRNWSNFCACTKWLHGGVWILNHFSWMVSSIKWSSVRSMSRVLYVNLIELSLWLAFLNFIKPANHFESWHWRIRSFTFNQTGRLFDHKLTITNQISCILNLRSIAKLSYDINLNWILFIANLLPIKWIIIAGTN